MTHVQEEFGADVIGHPMHFTELIGIVAVGLEVLDEGTEQADQFEDVFILLCGDNLLIDFLLGTGLQGNAGSDKLLLQVVEQGPSIFIL